MDPKENNAFVITAEEKKKKSKKKKILIALIFIFIIIIIATGIYFFLQPQPKEKKEVKKEKKEKEEIIEQNLTVVDLKSNKRPIAVMIDNNTGINNNNNHAGLQEAYLTYEIIVEGGLTRIMAIFKDKDLSLIGPVRSSRHYFLDYALESDAIYAHFGWSPYAQNDISALGVNNLNGLYLDEPFWRDTSISAPHNVFTTTDLIYQAAEKEGYQVTSNNWLLLNYSFDEIDLAKEEAPDLITANAISLSYSYNQVRSYQYDPTTKTYLRFMNGNPHNDKQTNTQLHYKNIIIEQVSNYTLDNEGRQDLNTVGSGEGYYITNGYARPIYWQKNSRDSKTIYTYTDGNTVQFNDGNTFIQIEPTNYQPEFN